jgi:hypothetical protein
MNYFKITFVKMLILATLAFHSLCAASYKLVIIQTVSKNKRSFVTRQGRKDAITPGLHASFSNERISILAKAKEVTRNYTIWSPVEKNLFISFKKGETLAFNRTAEYLSRFKPDESLKIKKDKEKEQTAISFNISLVKGLSQSFSGVSDYNYNRGGFQYHGAFHYSTQDDVYWVYGVTYESEATASQTLYTTSKRFYFTFNIDYKLINFYEFYNSTLYVSVGVGIGFTNTSILTSDQVGLALSLPETKFIVEFPFSKKNSFTVNFAFESISLIEVLTDKSKQTTDALNAKIGIGILNYY